MGVVLPWYKILQRWWNLVPKTGVPLPNLYESVPITIPSMDHFGIPLTISCDYVLTVQKKLGR